MHTCACTCIRNRVTILYYNIVNDAFMHVRNCTLKVREFFGL